MHPRLPRRRLSILARSPRALLPLLAAAALAGCGSDDSSSPYGGYYGGPSAGGSGGGSGGQASGGSAGKGGGSGSAQGGASGSSAGGSAGNQGGASGQGGSQGGKGGASGQGGSSGNQGGASGQGGQAGASGQGGAAGTAGGAAGEGGSAGNQGGASGQGGQAGASGQAGSAGEAGASGQAGSAGSAGEGGQGGSAGGSGQGGSAGSGQGGWGTGNVGPDVVMCPASLPASQSGVCDVVKGSTVKVVRGRVIGADHVYENGEVLIDAQGVVQCVGCDCSALPGYAGATTVTCAGGVVSPSLVNTHDHITYAQLSPKAHPGVKYDHRHEWRKGLNGKPKLNTPAGSPTADVVSWGEIRFLLGGAASTVGSGSSKGLLRNLDKADPAQEGLAQKAVDFDTFPLNDAGGVFKTSCAYSGFTTQSEVDMQDAYFPHVAEGVIEEAHNEFACSDGLPGSQVDYLKPQTAMIHAIGLKAADVAAMASDGTGLIWSPRSNLDLYGFTANVTAFSKLGVQIALGTDWSASGSMNLLRELACADSFNKTYLNDYFTDYDLYRMVTEDAAALAASDDKVGSLKPGLFGDVTVFDGKGQPAYGAVVRAKLEDVALVVRAGLVLSGEADLVDALSPDGGVGCESLDVCGAGKKVCVQRETGKTIDQLKASITAGSNELYPLFFCGTPDSEPSCVPSRPDEFTGAPAPGDKDGDGIADADDLCPDVFSAVRPMDNGAQADADGDKVGDACDVCPLKAGSTDCPLVVGDIDGDGLPDAKDNCPQIANADQADADADGKGDVCDSCPMAANPGVQPCPAQTLTIPDAKKLAVGSLVDIKGVCVTALHPSAASSNQFWVQDPTFTQNAGLLVFQNSTPLTVAVLDKVDISGTLSMFQGMVELDTPQITKVGTCLPIAPVVVADPSQLATGGSLAGPLVSMLVKVDNVAVVNPNPDAPQSYNEFAVTGNLRIDDFLYAYPMGSFPMGTTFTKLVGVAHYSFSNSKILPRSAADIVTPLAP